MSGLNRTRNPAGNESSQRRFNKGLEERLTVPDPLSQSGVTSGLDADRDTWTVPPIDTLFAPDRHVVRAVQDPLPNAALFSPAHSVGVIRKENPSLA
jgi:hypothetical protein